MNIKIVSFSFFPFLIPFSLFLTPFSLFLNPYSGDKYMSFDIGSDTIQKLTAAIVQDDRLHNSAKQIQIYTI